MFYSVIPLSFIENVSQSVQNTTITSIWLKEIQDRIILRQIIKEKDNNEEEKWVKTKKPKSKYLLLLQGPINSSLLNEEEEEEKILYYIDLVILSSIPKTLIRLNNKGLDIYLEFEEIQPNWKIEQIDKYHDLNSESLQLTHYNQIYFLNEKNIDIPIMSRITLDPLHNNQLYIQHK